MSGGGSPFSSGDLDSNFWAKLFGFVTVTGITNAQGKLIQVVGGEAAQGFASGALGLMFRRAAWQVAPTPIKVASLVMTGMSYLVKRPLGGLVYFAPEAMKRAIQYWGPQTAEPLSAIITIPDAGALVVDPGTSVIDKVPDGLTVMDTVKYMLGASVLVGSVYVIYRLYNRRPNEDE
ncbi:MAG TPA: hypothetical protein VGM82_05240 [Gemmatimonadaceae bacterium]|jgi:hypothetical protein